MCQLVYKQLYSKRTPEKRNQVSGKEQKNLATECTKISS